MRWFSWPVRATGLVLLGLAMVPAAGFADTVEETIKSRQSNTRDLGGGFNEIKKELARPKPMQFLIEQYATQMESLAQDQASWFPKGTGPESGYATQAKANIWTERAEFDALYQKSLMETVRLAQIAASKDYKALEAHLTVLKDACLACHGKFKERGEHDFQF